MSTGWILGVDFGTSNTAAAHTDVVSGAAAALALSHHGNLLPSAVFVESPQSILVGEVAIDRAQSNPAAFIPSPKRALSQGMLHANGYDLAPATVVAAVLTTVLTRATGVHGGQPPARLVLTHPEAWSTSQTQVLLDAAAALGFDQSRVALVSEPRAAAHHHTRTNPMTAGDTIAVFDFGGGTLDIAVLTATDTGTFTVTAARGDNGLGGKNLDALIRRWVDQELSDRNPDLLAYLRNGAPVHVLRGLEESIRRAKELLSEAPSASITVAANGHQETLLLNREGFDELIAPEIDRAVALTRDTFTDARLAGPEALKALYLTGGSSRIPLVHSRLAALGPVATLDDPKTVVAQGALIAAVHGGADNLAAAPQQPVQAPAVLPPVPAATPAPATAQWSQHPNAGIPAPAPTPMRPAPSQPKAAAKGRKGLLIGAGAAVVALVIVGTIAAQAMSGEDSPSNASGTTTTADSSPGVSGAGDAESSGSNSGSNSSSSNVEAITELLPPALARASDCKELDPGPGVSGDKPIPRIQCAIDPSSSVIAGLTSPGENVSFIASADKADAKKTLLGWREYDLGGVLTENTARTAGLYVRSSTADFINLENGLHVNLLMLSGGESAKKFMERAGLMN